MPDPIEEVLGYRFRDAGLLQEALTHKSHAFETGSGRHNERLEFLGDSVLAVVVAHHLFDEFPDEDEGRLSQRKSALVSRASMARWAEGMELGRHMRLGSGEESTGGRDRPSILSNALEALIGAVYVDGGFEEARRLIRRLLERQGEFVETDFKSRLQEVVQKRHKVPPSYQLMGTTGPEHEKTFSVKVLMGSRVLGAGTGKTKKEAEQNAARDALANLSRRARARQRH